MYGRNRATHFSFLTGIVLEYERDGTLRQRPIDLLDLSPDINVDDLVSHIIRSEPLLSESRRSTLTQLVYRLIAKAQTPPPTQFVPSKVRFLVGILWGKFWGVL